MVRNRDLPQLAKHFYRQSIEERNHAMMLVQYRLDRDLGITIPGVEAVSNGFKNEREPIALALEQEKRVTQQIEARIMVDAFHGLQYDLVVNNDEEGATAAFERLIEHHRERVEALAVQPA